MHALASILDSVPDLAISDMSSTSNIIVFIIAVIFSLAACFFGYRLLKIWSTIIGFIIGLIIGGTLADFFSKGNLWITIGVALVVGIILGVLAFFLYKVGVFILVLIESVALISNILTTLISNLSGTIIYIIAIVLGILIAILAIKLMRPVVIVVTALNGGSSIVSALIRFGLVSNNLILLIVFAVIAVAGMVVQFLTTSRA